MEYPEIDREVVLAQLETAARIHCYVTIERIATMASLRPLADAADVVLADGLDWLAGTSIGHNVAYARSETTLATIIDYIRRYWAAWGEDTTLGNVLNSAIEDAAEEQTGGYSDALADQNLVLAMRLALDANKPVFGLGRA